MKKEEFILQTKIIQYFRKNFYLTGALIEGTKNTSPSFLGGVRDKQNGLLAGRPDINIFLPNKRVVFFELKSKKGKLCERQENIKKKLENLGFEYYIINDFEIAKNTIDKLFSKLK